VHTAIECRSCQAPLVESVLDLGAMPLANAFVECSEAMTQERFTLHVWACSNCLLVQLAPDVPAATLFGEYSYLSSYSDSWMKHAQRFASLAIERCHLNVESRVVEIASNDGYLLRYFHDAGIPSLGVEPAANVAAIAERKGFETRCAYFGSEYAEALSREGWVADLVVANNVLAHVPDLNDFLDGLANLVALDGHVSIEVPHLEALVAGLQFDTIYHEHYSYFSLAALVTALGRHDLSVVDVERLSSHGGSLRVWAAPVKAGRRIAQSVESTLREERSSGLHDIHALRRAAALMRDRASAIVEFVRSARADGKRLVGYGAAAKATIVINYCGLGVEDIGFVADRNPLKQGRCVPGSSIPIVDLEYLEARSPDYILLFPWNLEREISAQLAPLSGTGCKIVTTMPGVRVLGWPGGSR